MIHKERVLRFTGPAAGEIKTIFRNRADPTKDYDTETKSPNTIIYTYSQGIQITESENHPEWLTRSKGKFTRDLGGPFYMLRGETTLSDNGIRTLASSDDFEFTDAWPNGMTNLTQVYQGPVLPYSPDQLPWPDWQGPTQSELNQLGTKAIAGCSPSNPSTDLAVAVGELFKDGIPSIVGGSLTALRGMTNRERRKAISGEYLNVEFGWKPLISDLQKTAKSIIHADKILKSYERDSGRLVRRKFDFPKSQSTSVSVFRYGVSPWLSPSSGSFTNPATVNQGQVLLIVETTKHQWFKGAFTYYVPPADSLRNSIARRVIQARKLLGISLTPDTLWNLAPWSWMVDWFTDTGDILSNWTDWAIDNQVLVYGYLMDHRSFTNTFTFVGPNGFKDDRIRPPSYIRTVEVKNRVKATPYGFGVDLSGLTGRQQAILAALGLNRK